MTDKYYVVTLIDRTVIDFDGMCDSIDYSDVNYVVFKRTTGINNRYSILAIIPHTSIFSIIVANQD